ncbi:cadherin-like beta sandwich domain-containing protein [Mucilaginibacter xinganensis]|uniref:Serine/threonine-protein kinase PknD n=1 Tax=Mucilaginibacter xinganensis TaxID=1234841 RepID=A0A223NSM3_9SPHI|nr:cadherin-like beta sandwich domain-containing protein [Mucilaginibacter xinganensis]ASU32658.1 Serine/threonine-protein kinase PknD [Mucilaginibacter xinganensis]
MIINLRTILFFILISANSICLAGNNIFVPNTFDLNIKRFPAGGSTPTKISPSTNYKTSGYNADRRSSVVVNTNDGQYPPPQLSYKGPQVYHINETIQPLVPTSSNVGPAGSIAITVAASGINSPRNVTIDTAGNVYFSQLADNVVKKIPAGGGTPITIGTGFNGPVGVAVDKQGNVYVADNGNNVVKKIAAAGGVITTIASGFNQPYGLAIDATGNLFVTNLGNGLLEKIPAGGGTVKNVGPAFNHPTGVALDAKGNIYVSDNITNLIQKIPVGSNTAITLASNVNDPYGVAVDGGGNVYYAELYSASIKEIPVSGGAIISIGSGLNYPQGIAIDTKNNLYIPDFYNTSIKEFTPTGGFSISPALPVGLNFNTSTGTISGTPIASSPATDYTVTAYNNDGLNSTNINIKVLKVITLANLTINSGTLSPVFLPSTAAYTAHVPNATSSIKITPTAGDSVSSIKVNGTAVSSGAASASLPLNVGNNAINIVVTAVDGTTTKTYVLTVTRSAAGLSTNALLTSIKISPSTPLTTVTGPGYKNYSTAVPNGETSLNLISVAQDTSATIQVNGGTVASGAAKTIPLKVGANVITVAVTAQDGATLKNYIITATRASSSVATLANLITNAGALNPAFATLTTAYTLRVPNATASIKLTPTATAGDASIMVNGTAVASGVASASIPLTAGDNVINTVVTASDGTTVKTYTLTVTRSAAGLSTNALLSSLKLSPNTALTTVTGPGYKNYATSVPNSETSLTVTAVLQDATATIKVNGTTVASGAASPSIPLAAGANVITVVVTAQDGATVKNYIITATRATSSIATLANLITNAGALNPVFATLTTAYTLRVPNATTSIKLTPTATAGDAAIKVNGTTTASGVASASVPLSVGDNVINTVVTASDGTTVKTYTLTVTRSAAGLSTNALLSSLKISPSTALTTVTGPGYKNYTTSVPNSETSLTVTSVVQDATATIKVNGTTVASGAASPSIPLAVGTNVITTTVTAQDGATVKNYIITATRAAGPVTGLSLAAQGSDSVKTATDEILVHQAISPNGDGQNDFLLIDGLAAYPNNNLSIATQSGSLVYNAKGYNNSSVVFDGHSSVNGSLQPRGTYFYLLEYYNGTQYKRKSGFIIIKY